MGYPNPPKPKVLLEVAATLPLGTTEIAAPICEAMYVNTRSNPIGYPNPPKLVRLEVSLTVLPLGESFLTLMFGRVGILVTSVLESVQ